MLLVGAIPHTQTPGVTQVGLGLSGYVPMYCSFAELPTVCHKARSATFLILLWKVDFVQVCSEHKAVGTSTRDTPHYSRATVCGPRPKARQGRRANTSGKESFCILYRVHELSQSPSTHARALHESTQTAQSWSHAGSPS